MFRKKELATVNSLRFISRTNFMLSQVEHEKSFISLGSGLNCLALTNKFLDKSILFYMCDHLTNET